MEVIFARESHYLFIKNSIEHYEWMMRDINHTNESESKQEEDYRMSISKFYEIELEVRSKHPTSKHPCEICGALGCFTDKHKCQFRCEKGLPV